jgi:hypothetical protein
MMLVSLGMLLAAAVFGGEDKKTEANPLLGCWQGEENAKLLYLFEAQRCIVSSDGDLSILKVKYAPGKVTWDGKTEATYEIKGAALTLTCNEQVVKFKKLDKTAPEVELKGLPLGKPDEVAPEKLKAIQDELAKRMKEDQAVRTDAARRDEMQKIDGENTEYLIKLVQEVGWIDNERFGRKAALGAFLIVQHSGHLQLMMAALPEIEKDLKKKVGDPQDYALLYDRLQLRLGGKQRYGSQLGRNQNGEAVVLPLEDKAKVEQFRKEIGLFPLAQYLGMFKQMNGGKDVKFSDE